MFRFVTFMTLVFCGAKIAAAEPLPTSEKFDASIEVDPRTSSWKTIPFGTFEFLLPGVGVARRGYYPSFGVEFSGSFILPVVIKGTTSILFYNNSMPDAEKYYFGIGAGGIISPGNDHDKFYSNPDVNFCFPVFVGVERNSMTVDLGLDFVGPIVSLFIPIPFARCGIKF